MKKYIQVILTIEGKRRTVQIDAISGLHELEIYEILQEIFTAYIFIDYSADQNTHQEGYNIIFKNGLESVTIYRAN
jgi:hypothetical protein